MNKPRSKFLGMVGAGVAALLAMMPGVKQAGNMPTMVTSQNAKSIAANQKQKSMPAPIQSGRNIIVEEIGGLPLMSYRPNYGMSPKEYGQLYGTGGSKKSNRLRYAHNAKVKRRNVC